MIGRVWSRITEFCVPPELRTDPDLERRARLFVAFALMIGTLAPIRMIQLVFVGAFAQAAFAFGTLLTAVGTLLLMRATGRIRLAAMVLLSVVFAVAARMGYVRGGIGAPMLVAISILPAIASFFGGKRLGALMTVAIIALVGGFAVAERGVGIAIDDQIPPALRFRLDILAPVLMALFMYGVGLAYEWTSAAARSAHARAERQRRGAEDAARMLQADRMASVGQLAAGVAHEINNPLAYITANLAFVQEQVTLMGPSASAETREALAEAREGIQRVAAIVLDLKTFTREDASDANLLDLRVVLDSTLRIVENEIKHKAELERRYPAEAAYVLATEPRLVQVFLNLLMNAVQALPAGRVRENRIAIEIRRTASGAHEVTVADSGPGMPPEILARAMDPFFTTKPVGVGTGLGLAVCRNVVRALGGEIQLDSEVGQGTRVIVTFPPPPAGIAHPREAVSPEPLATHQRLDVLVIDDDPLVARGLRRMLRQHEVTAVTSGYDAIAALTAGRRFDVILCDLMMPGLTGAEVHDRVAALGQGLEERIVFLTGGVFSDSVREFLEKIPNPRLTKPVNDQQLEAMLAAAARRRLKREHEALGAPREAAASAGVRPS